MATGATDAKGNLTFSGMFPHGDYYVKEISVPKGWLLSAEKYPVKLTSANKATSENVITVYLENPILNHLIYTPVTITKTDITGAEKLPGALIEVYDADGNTIYREYTNSKGEIPNIPVVPGTYTFKETYAPSGYALNVAIKTFTVTADGKVTGDTVIRDDLNRVELKKTKDNGEPLPGAVFGLFDMAATPSGRSVLPTAIIPPRRNGRLKWTAPMSIPPRCWQPLRISRLPAASRSSSRMSWISM